jgi:hypothetical protein
MNVWNVLWRAALFLWRTAATALTTDLGPRSAPPLPGRARTSRLSETRPLCSGRSGLGHLERRHVSSP